MAWSSSDGDDGFRDGIATDYGPGVGWPEELNTVHWLENRGTVPAIEVSVDLVSNEQADAGHTHSRQPGAG